MEPYRRTVEDATAMLVHAKQDENEVNAVTQVFYYPSQNSQNKNLKLMELDEKFIKLLEDGERLVFRGSSNEKVVLCTGDETFEVKEGEISNSLVVCPDLLYSSDIKEQNTSQRILQEKNVCGVYHKYLELRLTYPRLSKLRTFLNCTAYKGPKEDEKIHKGYYFSELLENIQCSKNELLAYLKEIRALYYEDKWRLVDLEYETRVLSYLSSLMEEQSWKEIHREESIRILKTLVPDYIVDHILMHFATRLEENKNLYIFKEEKVSRCFAEILLHTAEGMFRYDDFIVAWEQCVPPGVKPDIKHLRGLAIVEKKGVQLEVIHLFPEYNLPENISERFRLLFKQKEKWTLDEITPYVEKLATKTMNVSTMLTKYARASNNKGVRVFGARYAN